MKTPFLNSKQGFRVAIVGAGPAGSSLAIRLSKHGFDVTLIERASFPRQKLCGEFISPECLAHFEALGVLPRLEAAGGERIFETRFYLQDGQSFEVPAGVLRSGDSALGLSRAELDLRLLETAKAAGANVLEGTSVTGVEMNGGRIVAINAAADGPVRIEADLFIDATGRQEALSKLATRNGSERSDREKPKKPLAVAFKNHLSGVPVEPGVCEIFFFRGGYGGISGVENGLANVCLMVEPAIAKHFAGQMDEMVQKTIASNRRAGELLRRYQCEEKWLAVSLTRYGRAKSPSAANLLSVGDAEAFIDPFTGSGILMALEGSHVLAAAVQHYAPDLGAIGSAYRAQFQKRFAKRLRICSVLRRFASLPLLPSMVFRLLGSSAKCREMLAAATRSAGPSPVG